MQRLTLSVLTAAGAVAGIAIVAALIRGAPLASLGAVAALIGVAIVVIDSITE